MRHILISLLSAMVFIGQASMGQSLKSPPKAPSNPLAGIVPADPTCESVVDEIKKYNTMARDHDRSVADFVTEVSIVMSDWHRTLRPLEGETVPIQKGAFDNILRGSQQTEEVISMVYENSSFLEDRLNGLISKLEKCIPGKQ